MLAGALGELAAALEPLPEISAKATAVRRLALQIELTAGRVLIA